MIVFLRFGEFIMGGGHFPLTSDALKKVLTGEASMEIFRSLLHAVCCIFTILPLQNFTLNSFPSNARYKLNFYFFTVVGVVGFGTVDPRGTLRNSFTCFCDFSA